MLGGEAKYTSYLYVHTNSKIQARTCVQCTHTLTEGEVTLKHKILSTPIPAISHPANKSSQDYVITIA